MTGLIRHCKHGRTGSLRTARIQDLHRMSTGLRPRLLLHRPRHLLHRGGGHKREPWREPCECRDWSVACKFVTMAQSVRLPLHELENRSAQMECRRDSIRDENWAKRVRCLVAGAALAARDRESAIDGP